MLNTLGIVQVRSEPGTTVLKVGRKLGGKSLLELVVRRVTDCQRLDGVIVVGHTRYKAAIKPNLAEVPVHVARGLTPAQLKAYRIADNQTATMSTWDDDKLPLELAAS